MISTSPRLHSYTPAKEILPLLQKITSRVICNLVNDYHINLFLLKNMINVHLVTLPPSAPFPNILLTDPMLKVLIHNSLTILTAVEYNFAIMRGLIFIHNSTLFEGLSNPAKQNRKY